MAKKTGLGKGLDALIPQTADSGGWNPRTTLHIDAPDHSMEIAISLIDANPSQPRSEFNEEALEDLAASIKHLGIIQPITLRKKDDGRYQVISGERRLRAARMAGLTVIPAYVRKVAETDVLEMALVENIQREDLDAMEVAFCFQQLIEECHLTQEQLSERVGKKRATVTNYLRLLKLPAEIQLLIRSGAISMGHARALLSLDQAAAQMDTAGKIIAKELSVRQTEALIKKNLSQTARVKKTQPTAESELPDAYYRIVEIIGQPFNNNISVKRNEKGEGTITIHFTSDKEIETFLHLLEKTDRQ